MAICWMLFFRVVSAPLHIYYRKSKRLCSETPKSLLIGLLQSSVAAWVGSVKREVPPAI
eukprot:gene6445-4644_t